MRPKSKTRDRIVTLCTWVGLPSFAIWAICVFAGCKSVAPYAQVSFYLSAILAKVIKQP